MAGSVLLFYCAVTGTKATTANEISAVGCTNGNIIQDPGFEATSADATSNPSWNTTSQVFDSAFCSLAVCGDGGGTAGPRNGTFWTWFGGTDGPETATISQLVTIPSGATATLNYYLRIGTVESPFTDVLRVKVDGAIVQSITEPSTSSSTYSLQSVSLNSYANGVPHTISFEYVSPAGGGIANFNVDDVTVDVVCPAPPAAPGHLANISTRGFVGTGDNVMIAGFIIQGPDPKKVLIRARGPALAPFGLAALANPTLELHNSAQTIIATNDNWQSTQLGGIITTSQVADIQNTGLAPSDPADSAIIATLAPGSYSAIEQGANSGTGVGIVEVFDIGTGSSILANISTRGFVGINDNVMIGGFIVQGSHAKKVLIRARGPALAGFGLTALSNPVLELHDGNQALIATNDNWQTTQLSNNVCTDEAADIQATGLPPSETADSAILATLAPGNYTAVVHGTNSGTGVGIVEVYDLGDSPIQITSVPNANAAAPLTAMSLATTGINPANPVTVTFCNGAGFFVHEQPVRVENDGTVVVGVPVYVDPATNHIGAGAVSLVVSQGSAKSAPVPVQIQNLPPLSAYGTALGDISHAFLTYKAMLLGDRLNLLQSAHLIQTPLNTSTAQSHTNTLLVGTIKSRGDIDAIKNNNSTVMNWGTMPDGSPIQFDKDQLEMMDRILGVYLTQQFAGFSSSASASVPGNELDSVSPASVMSSLLDSMTSRDGVPAIIDYVQGSGHPADAGMALLNPLINAYTDNPGFPGAVGVAVGVSHFNDALNNTLSDISAAVGCNGDATCINGYVSKIQSDGLAIASADAEAIAHIPVMLGMENSAQSILSGVLSYIANYAAFADSGATDADNQTTGSAIQTSILSNLGQMTGTANVSGQNSIGVCCLGSGSSPVKGVSDPGGSYNLVVPIGLGSTAYNNMTLTVGDIVSGSTLDSSVVDLTGLDATQPVQIPPPITLGSYDGSYTGTYSGAAVCSLPDGTVVSQPVATTAINFSVSNGVVSAPGANGSVTIGGAITITYPSANTITFQGTITLDGHINNGSWSTAGLPPGCSTSGSWNAHRQ